MVGGAGVPWCDRGTKGRQGGRTETDKRGTGREVGVGRPGGAHGAGAHPCCGRMPASVCRTAHVCTHWSR